MISRWKWLRNPNLPLVLLLLINIVVGLLTFQDYGLSWDEPLFYRYADAIGYAYSIPEHLSGDFDIYRAYGPSAEDHKMYGPAYLLLARNAVRGLNRLLGVGQPALWHLSNFLLFQAGIAALYALARRWVSPWAAFGAALMFSTQPVLWGHAFINPKDMPFMAFFILAVFLGFRLADRLADPVPQAEAATLPALRSVVAARWPKIRMAVIVFGFTLGGIWLLSLLLRPQIEALVTGLIIQGYHADPQSTVGRFFHWLAEDAGKMPDSYYTATGIALLAKLRRLLAVLAVPLAASALAFTAWPAHSCEALAAAERRIRRSLDSLSFAVPRGRLGWLLRSSLVPGMILGTLIAIRVLGPAAGAIVVVFFLLKPQRRYAVGMLFYLIVAALVAYAAWPFLWDNPLSRFAEVLAHMANNPTTVGVLFQGQVVPSTEMPGSYLPIMLSLTLTEPVWPLFLLGAAVALWRMSHRRVEAVSLALVLGWFLLPFGYVLLARPPMYDGYRHFLFILPPVFMIAGLAFDQLAAWLRSGWLKWIILAGAVLPGLVALLALHPYQYTYYNSLAGGVHGAFRQYETDYWLTCYKEAMPELNRLAGAGQTIFVDRYPPLAREYAAPGVRIEPYEPDADTSKPGDLLLLSTRSNRDQTTHPDDPVVYTVSRQGADFCVVKQVQK